MDVSGSDGVESGGNWSDHDGSGLSAMQEESEWVASGLVGDRGAALEDGDALPAEVTDETLLRRS